MAAGAGHAAAARSTRPPASGSASTLEQQRCVAHRPREGARRVLALRDRHDAAAAHEPERRLDADDAVGGGGAHDRAVRLGADRERREARRDRDRRAARRTARVAVEHVRVARLPAEAAPAARRPPRAKIRPFAQIGLAEDHGAGCAQPRARAAHRRRRDDPRARASLRSSRAHRPCRYSL